MPIWSLHEWNRKCFFGDFINFMKDLNIRDVSRIDPMTGLIISKLNYQNLRVYCVLVLN